MSWTLRQSLVSCAFAVAWFHVTRNFTPAYFAIQFLTLVLASACLLSVRLDATRVTLLLFFSGAWLYVACISVWFADTYGSAAIGIVRLFSILPYIFLLVAFPRDDIHTAKLWKYFALFCGLAALTIPYQHMFGAIGWFAEASERIGVERFAALTGSLTTFGLVLGPAFVAAFVLFRGVARILLIGAMILGAVLSLQKASIGNIVLAVLFLWYAGRIRLEFKKIAGFLVGAAVVVTAVAAYVPFVADVATNMFMSAAGIDSETAGTDVSINQSIVDRLLELPKASIVFFGPSKLLTGVGVFGASGGLGYPELPMMHNALGEIYIVYGSFFGSAFVILMCVALYRSFAILRGAARTDDVQCVNAVAYILSLVNALFSGGNFYQPVVGFALWLAFTEVLFYSRGVVPDGLSKLRIQYVQK